MMEEAFLRPATVAKRYGIAEQTLANMRSRGEGPRYQLLSRRVLYRPEDVAAWIDEHAIVHETTAAGG
jgi:predicted DNA-binding transcriptional regulator AlpA